MADAKTILNDILADLLLMGSLAASIFVKNPQHQQVAGKLISASAQAIQQIHNQLQPDAAIGVTTTGN